MPLAIVAEPIVNDSFTVWEVPTIGKVPETVAEVLIVLTVKDKDWPE